MKKTLIVLLVFMTVTASQAFALFAHPDKTPETVTTTVAVTGKSADVAVQTAAEKISAASETIQDKGKVSDKTASQIINAAATITKYSTAIDENEKFHFGIGAGVTYQIDNSVGVEADLLIRKKNVFLITGAQYSPAKAISTWDNSNLRFHAVVGWEF